MSWFPISIFSSEKLDFVLSLGFVLKGVQTLRKTEQCINLDVACLPSDFEAFSFCSVGTFPLAEFLNFNRWRFS